MKYKWTRKMLAKELMSFRTYACDTVAEMLLEPAEWPQEGDDWWSLGIDLEPNYHAGHDEFLSKILKKVGNCFRTKKEAIKAGDKIKSLLKEIK